MISEQDLLSSKFFSLDFVRSSLDKEESKKINSMIDFSLKNNVYLSLILLDFTYLNKKFGYEAGDFLKDSFNEIFKRHLNSNVLYYNITSGKIFLYTKEPLLNEFKKDLDELHLKLETKNFLLGGKKVVFYIDESTLTNKPFLVNNDLSVVEMINKCLYYEYNLTRYRNFVQNYLVELNNLESQEEITKLNKKFSEGFNEQNPNIIKITSFDESSYEEIFNKLIPYVKNSDYLTNAFNDFKLNIKNYQDWSYYSQVFIKELAKYLIWVEMQTLQFEGFKVEKVYTYFYRHNPNQKRPLNESIVRFDTKQGLQAWFDSVVRTLENTYLSDKEKLKIDKIRNRILKLNFNSRYSKRRFALAVQDLFDNLLIKGLYNIPLEKVKPTDIVLQFFKTQLYLNFGTEYIEKYEIWRRSSFVKEGYYTFVKLPKLMNQTFNFFDIDLNNLKLNLAFLEIDGFNAFNTYYFPNDTDSIIYSKILEGIYEVANKYLMDPNPEKQSFFSKLIISVMGDEFFFLIPKNSELSDDEKNWYLNFLEDIRKQIVKLCKNIKFYDTEKIDIRSNGTEVTFRKPLVEKEKFYQKDIMLPIATIGVSGFVKFDINYVESDFPNKIKQLDNEMKEIKKDIIQKGKINIGK